jgi:hypothetical protein
MVAPHQIVYDGNTTVIEVLGSALRQALPAEQHEHIPELVDRISCSCHVGENLDVVFRDLTDAQREEFWREFGGAVQTFGLEP